MATGIFLDRRPGYALVMPTHNGWSRASAITDYGLIMGIREDAHPSGCSFVRYTNGEVVEIYCPNRMPFHATAINNSGLVVGVGYDSAKKRQPLTWTMDSGIKPVVDAHEQFNPTDVDDHGNIIGNMIGDAFPLTRPYICTSFGTFLLLPFALEHNTEVVRMNGRGIIIGSAWKSDNWRDTHPFIWEMKRTGNCFLHALI
jgi:hypothetical protein